MDINREKMLDQFQSKAAKDPGYAIAYALLEIARQQEEIAHRLDDLGLHQYTPSGAPGTTEKIAMELSALVEAVSYIRTKV